MSANTDSCHDLDMTEPESNQNVYSPASSYSTYSGEVKYIFNPKDKSRDEYMDYSHINSRTKQNYMSHTPRTLSASSQLSGKENRTPHCTRDELVFDPQQHMPSQHVASSRTSSVLSSVSRGGGPFSPHMEEAVYSGTQGYRSCKPRVFSDQGPKEGSYFSSDSEMLPYPYVRTSHPVLKNNMLISLHPHNMQKPSNFNHDMHNNHIKNNAVGSGLNTFQSQHPLSSIHNFHHYQQLNNAHSVVTGPYHPQEQLNHSHEHPYPMPPGYTHQQHSRRKTWSPPALKMSLAIANSQGSRVCYSHDSLDIAEESTIERKTQSLSEDLDMTPPRLAPVSGVLAQKPGQNLIRPIAFKPIHASSTLSPVGHATHQPGTDDHMIGSHNTTRPRGMKLGNSVLGIQGSPESHNGRSDVGVFSPMAKFQYHSLGGGNVNIHTNSHHAADNINHPLPLTSHSQNTSVDSPSNGSHHNLSLSSHHSISSNSYNNIPVSSHINVNSSRLSAGDETSISAELRCPSERPDSIPSFNMSHVLSHAAEDMLQTPSPSDSGVGELEAMLREKDAEINTLREVMERNERAIFQVYEERRNVWLHETQELQNEYERRLKIQSRKSYKTEQVLSLQVYKLQQEQKILHEEKAKVIIERDMLRQQADENQKLISHFKQKFEAVRAGEVNCEKHVESTEDERNNKAILSFQEELALKNKELIILKSQLHSFQTDMEKKNREFAEKVRELYAKTDEIKSLKDELHLKDPAKFMEMSTQTSVSNEMTTSENVKSYLLQDRDHAISDMQEELIAIQAQVTLLKEEHEKEREQWLDEKNKVIRYQKQLQLNYVQMQRKNAALETEVQQLTLELENRDMKLIALNGEESIC